MTELSYHTVTIDSWERAKSLFSVDRTGWAWRGHADANWSLASNLERGAQPGQRRMAENALLQRFTRRAHHYLGNVPARDHILQWLSTMQHYGAPTRLLDWTYSPYVAAFFALERAVGDAAVWAIDLDWCRSEASRAIVSALRYQAGVGEEYRVPGKNIWEPEMFKLVYIENNVNFVAPVEPHLMNERLTIQQGLFLCQGNLGESFEQNLGKYDTNGGAQKRIIKFVLPISLRSRALSDLDLMDINRATLFPGIDGFAQSLNLVLVQLEDPENALVVKNLPNELEKLTVRPVGQRLDAVAQPAGKTVAEGRRRSEAKSRKAAAEE